MEGHSASVRRLFAPKSTVVCCGDRVLSVMGIFHQLTFCASVDPLAFIDLDYLFS
jgi:hypothetical protein